MLPMIQNKFKYKSGADMRALLVFVVVEHVGEAASLWTG